MADYNILMHQLNASGTYDNLFPKTKGGLVEGPVANSNALGGYNYTQVINNAVAQALAGAAKIQTGSYVGTGTSGPNNPNTLTFDFAPDYVLIITIQNSYNNPYATFWTTLPLGSSTTPLGYTIYNVEYIPSFTTEYKEDRGFIHNGKARQTRYAKKSGDGKTIYWYVAPSSSEESDTSSEQFNMTIDKYYWLALAQ